MEKFIQWGAYNLHSSPNNIRHIKSRRNRWAGHLARMGEERKLYKISVGKPEGKRTLERPGRRWENVIKMDLRDIDLKGVNWIHQVQDMDRLQTR
jgi:hypothetical protein